MKLQTEVINLTESGKAYYIKFFHPITFRKYTTFVPVSHTKILKFNEIEIPQWLWSAKMKEL